MNKYINIHMIKNIISEFYGRIVLFILLLGVAILGYSLDPLTIRDVLETQKLPNGEIYIEYKNSVDVGNKIGDPSMIGKDGKYHEIDYTPNILLVFVGSVAMIIVGIDLFKSIKNSEVVTHRREIYNLRNVRMHYQGGLIHWVFDDHIIQSRFSPTHDHYELIYSMQDYIKKRTPYEFIKFIE